MITRSKIAPAGPEFSSMVYGTWRMLDHGSSIQDINRRLNRCLDLGITTIDTAEIYGGYAVEAALGEALSLSPGLREKLEIVTKADIYIPTKDHPERRVAHYDASGERLIDSLERSLTLIGTDHVDLFIVHRPDWLTAIDDTASGLNQLVKAGKIRSAGVSNYSATQFDALNSRMEQPLATNQVEFHLLNMNPIFDGVLDQCQTHRIRPMAWSPLAGGRLFAADNEAAIRLQAEAAALASKYDGATLEQFAYAWIMAHPSRPLPVIGTNRIDRLEGAARAAELKLEREDWFGFWVAAKGHGIP
jgi:predicted oxidoreductase